MADIINLRKRADDVTISQKQAGYSKVRIYAGTDSEGNDIVYEAGDDSGHVLEIDNEFGTQVMAQNILNDIAGMQYQPGIANGALVDPAAEMGDSISVNNNSIGMYIRYTSYSRLMKSNVEAPTNQEIEHEFAADKSSDRQYKRFMNQTKSRLGIMSTEIDAKVSIESQNTETGFGWSLRNNKWTVGKYQGSTLNPVLEVDENGVQITGSGTFTGVITATGGSIGGLTINQDGSIQSANGNFKVDAAGNLTATSGTFAGSVYASNIKSDAVHGYGGSFSGAGLSGGSVGAGKIVPYDLTTGQFSGGVNTSLGYANFSDAVFHRQDTAPYVEAGGFYGQLYMIYQGSTAYSMSMHTHTFRESGGKIYIGGADWTGGDHSFNIADTQEYKDGVSAAGGIKSLTIKSVLSSDRTQYTLEAVATANNGEVVKKTGYTGNAAWQAGRASAPAPHYAVFTVQAISASGGGTVYIYSSETGLMRLSEGDSFDQT